LTRVGTLPLVFSASLGDLRPRFLPKGQVGRGHRAIARNGRVLLASDLPVQQLAGRVARVRLDVWHKAILPGDLPTPYGLLLCIRTGPGLGNLYEGRLVPEAGPSSLSESARLALDVGGGMVLEFG
jgi:hypothetical protein